MYLYLLQEYQNFDIYNDEGTVSFQKWSWFFISVYSMQYTWNIITHLKYV